MSIHIIPTGSISRATPSQSIVFSARRSPVAHVISGVALSINAVGYFIIAMLMAVTLAIPVVATSLILDETGTPNSPSKFIKSHYVAFTRSP